jgi:hypothetical protein
MHISCFYSQPCFGGFAHQESDPSVKIGAIWPTEGIEGLNSWGDPSLKSHNKQSI